jgi:uncharacterized membrane protein YagU involved in acid resistance
MTHTLQAIVLATLICGILDAAAASTQAMTLGISPRRVWQGVASGLLGSRALQAGRSTAALGLVLHFFIAFIISTIYVLAAERLPFLLQHALLAGALYGIAVYLVMNYIVLPLSRRAKRPFNLKFAATQLVIHIVIVGWSIALSARHVLRVLHIS